MVADFRSTGCQTSAPSSASSPFNPFAAPSDASSNPFATASNPFSAPISAFTSEPAPQPEVDALGAKVAEVSLVVDPSPEDDDEDEESEPLDPGPCTRPRAHPSPASHR